MVKGTSNDKEPLIFSIPVQLSGWQTLGKAGNNGKFTITPSGKIKIRDGGIFKVH